MRDKHDITVLDAASLLAIAFGGATADARLSSAVPAPVAATPPVGIWRSADGAVRLDIRDDGTYAGRVAGRRQRPQGTYDVHGATLTLSDEGGLQIPVTVHGETLEMAGHRLARAA